jgi:20S proteasome subunit beta 4
VSTPVDSAEEYAFANSVSREVLLGITGMDFTLIAASKAAMRGATVLKASDDKTRHLNKHTLMAFSGEAGDTGRLGEICQRGAKRGG